MLERKFCSMPYLQSQEEDVLLCDDENNPTDDITARIMGSCACTHTYTPKDLHLFWRKGQMGLIWNVRGAV